MKLVNAWCSSGIWLISSPVVVYTVDIIPNKILKIRQIQGYNYFSKFDCKSGFYHLKLEEESKKLTAFTVPQGFYEWNVLPFGYKNAPGRFQHFMDLYFTKLPNCIVYIDDILLYSRTYDEHIKLLEQFITIVEESGISLSKNKADIMKTQIEFLGIQIDKDGIKMQQHIVQKIMNSEEILDTKKKLQSFLGLVNQVREYIPKLAEYLKPLQRKLKKDVEYNYNKTDQQHVKKIKEQCKQLPKLCFPNEKKVFSYIVESDASENSYGGVLKYKYEDNKIEYHCRYYSGTFSETEIKWEINRMTKDYIIPEEITAQPLIQKMEIPEFYTNKRIIGLSTILAELANIYEETSYIWKYHSRNHLLIYSTAKELRSLDKLEVKNWALSLLKPELTSGI